MAYAAVVSLAQKLEQINEDPNHLLHSQAQNQPLLRLHENVVELQAIMGSSPEKTCGVEARIARCANEAEDVIDGCFFDYCWETLERDLHKLKNETDAILEEVIRVKGGEPEEVAQANEWRHHAGVSRGHLSGKHPILGFDGDIRMLQERIYGGSSNLQVIPIVGMGGSGKTTLAAALYENRMRKRHFDVCAWITVSQRYNLRRALAQLLGDITGTAPEGNETINNESLGVSIYQELKLRRYLIVIDDIWSTKFWDDIKRILPDDGNRSRILLTTRLEDIAACTVESKSCIHEIPLLDLERSWCLLKMKVFGENHHPVELEDIGKTIVKYCGGLPLAIIVVSGLLLSVDPTEDSWRRIADNVGASITSNSGQILDILRLSYNHLPHHLKPCFLHIGIFPEDNNIRVSRLIRLWVAEGFLKPIRSKSLEETAYLYLEDLVRRNLIFVSHRRSTGLIRVCRIHDFVRHLCVKTAQQEQFLHHLNDSNEVSPHGIKNPRRLSVCADGFEHHPDYSSLRSIWYLQCRRDMHVPLMSFRLVKVLDAQRIVFSRFPIEVCKLFHLRYLSFSHKNFSRFKIPPCIDKLQNLQVLTISPTFNLFSSSYSKLVLPMNIYNMPELRHLSFNEKAILPEPACESSSPLKNLQTLYQMANLRVSKEVLEVIPNIKKLGIFYSGDEAYSRSDRYYLENLAHLSHLESLSLASEWDKWFPFWEKMMLPQGLKKLSLTLTRIPWTRMGKMIGSLPNLEVLKLRQNACTGQIWETKEGDFTNLKVLELDDSFPDVWISDDSSHFPRLEKLCMYNIRRMRELPSCIRDIDTLQLIEVDKSNAYVVEWATELQEEKLSLGNELLQFHIHTWAASNKFMRRVAVQRQC